MKAGLALLYTEVFFFDLASNWLLRNSMLMMLVAAQMQALMAEANAAKAKAEKEKEAAEAALKAKNSMPVMLRGAKLNIAVKPPVAGNALSAAAAKAAQQQQQQPPASSSTGDGESATPGGLAKTGAAPVC